MNTETYATTGLAARELGLDYTDIELKPAYQHPAAERLGLNTEGVAE